MKYVHITHAIYLPKV